MIEQALTLNDKYLFFNMIIFFVNALKSVLNFNQRIGILYNGNFILKFG